MRWKLFPGEAALPEKPDDWLDKLEVPVIADTTLPETSDEAGEGCAGAVVADIPLMSESPVPVLLKVLLIVRLGSVP